MNHIFPNSVTEARERKEIDEKLEDSKRIETAIVVRLRKLPLVLESWMNG